MGILKWHWSITTVSHITSFKHLWALVSANKYKNVWILWFNYRVYFRSGICLVSYFLLHSENVSLCIFPQGQLCSVCLHKIVTKFPSILSQNKAICFLPHLHEIALCACEMSNGPEQLLWLSHKTGLQVCYYVKKQSFKTTSHTDCWDQTWNHQGPR